MGFKAYLPDCRAYEMVSPPFTDGQRVDALAVSSDGSHTLAQSIGVFGGSESDSVGKAVYVSTRLGSGWATSAISPPASLFPDNSFLAASTDLGRTLWAMRGLSQSIYAEDLYVREPDSTFVKVGPMVPPSGEAGPPAGGTQALPGSYQYAGASSDLTHVLFRIEASSALWPGDTTANSTDRSLYEYVGRENRQPELVGICTSGLASTSCPNGEGHLISNCETSLGSERARDAYNAVSANGKTVFFTSSGHNANTCGGAVAAPQFSELFARLDETETVGISEPSPSQCLECHTATKAPAEFQGAAEDGSKAYFTTEQELFAGDTTMNLYEYDFGNINGKKIVRASIGSSTPEVLGVARISEDGSHAYFVAKGVLTEGKNVEGNAPVPGGDNLYVFERDAAHPGGRVTFVATLLGADSADWNVDDERPVQSTPDGRFLVFESIADLTPGDTSTEPQVFEYDALEGKLVRISIGQAGYADGMANANANGSRVTIQGYNGTTTPTEAETRLAVSADGSRVVFDSTGALTPDAQVAAASAAKTIYEYRSAGSLANGNVYLISDGNDINKLSAAGSGTETLGIDTSGGDVFLETADPLLAQDVDTQYDIYDARADGGFPAPATPAGCEGEACQGATSVQSSFGLPGSVSVPGGANVSPPPSPVAKPAVKPLTRAQRLAKALAACRHKPKKKRPACEKQARRAYGPARTAKKSRNGGK